MANDPLDTLDERLKDVIETLFKIQFVLHGYSGPDTQAQLVQYISQLGPALHSASAADPATLPLLPPEVITDYIEQGRNPDIYTREFVERVRRDNSYFRCKAESLESFRDALAEEIISAGLGGDEMRAEVERSLAGAKAGAGGRERDHEEQGANAQRSNAQGPNGAS